MKRSSKLVWGMAAAALLIPAAAIARDQGEGNRPWAFRTGILLGGTSDSSEPAGYKVYSPIALEAGIRRMLSHSLSLEFVVVPESREVDRGGSGGGRTNLGSIELVPMTLVLQYHPGLGGAIHPYAGAGLNFTVCWEKSGALDSADLTPAFGPAIQIGSDFDLSPQMMFYLNLKWVGLTTDLEANGTRMARLKISPSSLSAGLRFRF